MPGPPRPAPSACASAGRRRSPSTATVVAPERAIAIARFAVTVVLPCAGDALVTRIVRNGRPTERYCRFARSARNASGAEPLADHTAGAMSPPPRIHGIWPITGAPNARLDRLARPELAVEVLPEECAEQPEYEAERTGNHRVALRLRRDRPGEACAGSKIVAVNGSWATAPFAPATGGWSPPNRAFTSREKMIPTWLAISDRARRAAIVTETWMTAVVGSTTTEIFFSSDCGVSPVKPSRRITSSRDHVALDEVAHRRGERLHRVGHAGLEEALALADDDLRSRLVLLGCSETSV